MCVGIACCLCVSVRLRLNLHSVYAWSLLVLGLWLSFVAETLLVSRVYLHVVVPGLGSGHGPILSALGSLESLQSMWLQDRMHNT